MNDAINSSLKRGTWTLAPPPSDGITVGCKWVYKIKQKLDGSLEIYKARLVAKGYHEQHGIHFDDVFSPVMKLHLVNIVLVEAPSH